MKPLPSEVIGPSGKVYSLVKSDDERPIYARNETDENGDVHTYVLDFSIRSLTPREYGRLMGVPEWAIDRMLSSRVVRRSVVRPYIRKCNLYRLFGNSIVVPCMSGIFENIFYPNEEV